MPYFTSRAIIDAAAGLDPATNAWIAAVGGANVSTPRRTLVNNLIVGLKADGVWAKLDRLWLFAAENSQSALIDLVGDTAATPVLSPTFSTTGYTFSGSNYIDTGFNAATLGVNYTKDSCHGASWPVDVNSGWAMFGTYDGGQGAALEMGATWFIYINDNTQSNTFQAAGPGFILMNRTALNARSLYINGAATGYTDATASTAVASVANFVGAVSSSGTPGHFSANQIAAQSFGAGLNATENTNFYTRLRTYMTAAGVP